MFPFFYSDVLLQKLLILHYAGEYVLSMCPTFFWCIITSLGKLFAYFLIALFFVSVMVGLDLTM